jgi:hypothetical protein
MIGTPRATVATLDQPTEDGYIPLTPATWYCAVQTDQAAQGELTLVGRYHPGLTTRVRLTLKGRIFHVNAVHNRGERDVELIVQCSEVFE